MPTASETPDPAVAQTAGEAVRTARQAQSGARPAVPLFDRELSWLQFDRRVLGEAENEAVPLLERLKFLAICANNLDEFLMIRVGEIRDLIAANLETSAGTGRLDMVRRGCRDLLDDMYRCLGQTVLPALVRHSITVERVRDLGRKDSAWIEEYFRREVEPVLTPMAIDPGHPFPFIANLALNMALVLTTGRGETHVVVLRVPESVPRLVRLPDQWRFVLLEEVIAAHVGAIFPGQKVTEAVPFRVIRNSDFSIKEDDVQDLLKTVESELRRRERSEVVWMEVAPGMDPSLLKMITRATQTNPDDVFVASGPLRVSDLMQVCRAVKEPALQDAPFNPRLPEQMATTEDIFSIIRRGDVLLHRPYDSFTAVVEFVQAAADDPDVVAIKQTLYRTDPGSPIVEALATAAQRGKEVTAVVELQARFDEKKNITWARHLEQAGVQVVYGLVGIKTHCKLCLVVRRESGKLKRYLHLSTGNYNALTGRLYTDVDLFTADKEFGADAAKVMNLLTGFSVAGMQELIATRQPLKWKQLVVSPLEYQAWTIRMIDRETANAAAGRSARIVAKMNALVEPTVIEALYRASKAGVTIDLLVRGTCCLVPGLAGVSENIRVISVVDRFLEHARIFRFENDGRPEVYISSGDWMPRNFIRRIEVTFPIRDPRLIDRIDRQILPIELADDVKAWTLKSDGSYVRRTPDPENPLRSQEAFIALARAEAVSLGPYDESIRTPGTLRRKARKKKKH